MSLSEDQQEQFKEFREVTAGDVEESLRMSERQVSAHYTFDPMSGTDISGEIQDQFDIHEDDANRAEKSIVEHACRERFKKDHDLTFSTNYFSVEKDRGRWQCTIITNQT